MVHRRGLIFDVASNCGYTRMRRQVKARFWRSEGVYQYKTVVTDYEGMQEALDNYGAQGWRLVSVGPDTWRRTMSQLDPTDVLHIDAVPTPAPNLAGAPPPLPDEAAREYMASYYLLVFERAGQPEHGLALEAAAEPLEFSNYSLSEYS